MDASEGQIKVALSLLCEVAAEARARALEEAARLTCPQCRAGRPLNSKGEHTAKEGGDILLPVGPCQAWSIWQALKEAPASTEPAG